MWPRLLSSGVGCEALKQQIARPVKCGLRSPRLYKSSDGPSEPVLEFGGVGHWLRVWLPLPGEPDPHAQSRGACGGNGLHAFLSVTFFTVPDLFMPVSEAFRLWKVNKFLLNGFNHMSVGL